MKPHQRYESAKKYEDKSRKTIKKTAKMHNHPHNCASWIPIHRLIWLLCIFQSQRRLTKAHTRRVSRYCLTTHSAQPQSIYLITTSKEDPVQSVNVQRYIHVQHNHPLPNPPPLHPNPQPNTKLNFCTHTLFRNICSLSDLLPEYCCARTKHKASIELLAQFPRIVVVLSVRRLLRNHVFLFYSTLCTQIMNNRTESAKRR